MIFSAVTALVVVVTVGLAGNRQRLKNKNSAQ